MPCAAADRHLHGPRAQRGLLKVLRLLLAALLILALSPEQAHAQSPPVEVVGLSATRGADVVSLDYQLRVQLPPPVEDAARRGVPLYFVATATLWRPRWYTGGWASCSPRPRWCWLRRSSAGPGRGSPGP